MPGGAQMRQGVPIRGPAAASSAAGPAAVPENPSEQTTKSTAAPRRHRTYKGGVRRGGRKTASLQGRMHRRSAQAYEAQWVLREAGLQGLSEHVLELTSRPFGPNFAQESVDIAEQMRTVLEWTRQIE